METNDINVNGLIIKASYYNALKGFDNETFSSVFRALFEYGFSGIEPEFSNPVHNMAFQLIKPNIDSDLKRYKANAENGKKGGRPSKSSTKENNSVPSKSSTTEITKEIAEVEVKNTNNDRIQILDHVMKLKLSMDDTFELIEKITKEFDKTVFEIEEIKYVDKFITKILKTA